MKEIKEVSVDSVGNGTVEYADGTCYKYNQHNIVKELSKRSVFLNDDALTTMTSPPTITLTDEGNVLWTGSSLNTSGRLFNTNTGVSSGVVGHPSAFSIFRASYPSLLGDTYPNYFYTKFDTAEDTIGSYGNYTISVSFTHTGSKFALAFKGVIGHVAVKVDNKWVSLTPTSVPNDGNLRILIVDFGSSNTRRIDILAWNMSVKGLWVDANDSISPAIKRGPRVCVITDSFGSAGNEVSSLFAWPTYFAEYLGWDDVFTICSGGTGLISDNSGTKKKYIDRISRDVVPLSPDIVVIQMSINDNGRSVSDVLEAAKAIFNKLKDITRVVFTSPSINSGAGGIVSNNSSRLQSNAVKEWCNLNGIGFIDWIEQPFVTSNSVAHSTTLTSSPSAGATSFTTTTHLIVGATYKFTDGTACYVKSVSGLTATVDRVPRAQISGSQIVQCGNCVFTGTGRQGATTGWGNADLCVSTDGTHPMNLGHKLLGETAARQMIDLI